MVRESSKFKSLCPKLKWLMLVPTNLIPWYPLAYRAESKFLWSCSYFTQVLFQISSRSTVLLWVFWVVYSPFPFLMSRHVMLIGVWAVEKKLKKSQLIFQLIFSIKGNKQVFFSYFMHAACALISYWLVIK